jgi:two-component system NtrC family sensor kinase
VSEDFFNDLDGLTSGTESTMTGDGLHDEELGLTKLASLVEDLNRNLSTTTILERAMSAAIELTGAERGFLVLVNESGAWSFQVARNMESGEIADAEKAASHTVIRRVLERREPILINDVVGASDLTQQQSIAKMQVRSVMGAPLVAKGKLLGAAYVDTSKLAGVFDQTSLVLFESFVQLAAVALENARLIEAERAASTRYRDLQEYLITVLTSQPHGIVILDDGMNVEYANPQASMLLNGAHLAPGVAFSTSGGMDEETLLVFLADLHEFMEEDEVCHSTFQQGNRTLTYSFFHVFRAVENGVRVGVILEDITAQKKLERKLVESEKRSTINQLASGIAHEINNSLQPVKGRVELLTMRLKRAAVPLEGGIDKDLETISALSERIEKIAKNLRHLTKPAKPQFERLNLTQLVRSTVELMDSTTGKLKHFSSDPDSPYRLVVDLAENCPAIFGDAHGLESAIINMILNSSHAIMQKEDGGTLSLATHHEGDKVELVVEDTGGGIRPDVLPHVFEPYFTTRTDVGGTGLGMCILQNVAEIHNAKLDLHSEWGVGTRITLTFRAIREDAGRSGG